MYVFNYYYVQLLHWHVKPFEELTERCQRVGEGEGQIFNHFNEASSWIIRQTRCIIFAGGTFFSSVFLGLSFKFYAKSSDNLIAHLTLHLNGGSFYFPKKCANFFFLHVGSFIITLTPIRTRSNWNKPHYLIALEGLEMNVEPVLVPH